MNKLIASITVIAVMVTLNILTMIYGWGLKAESWWWIIGVGIFAQIFMKAIGDAVLKSDR